MFVSFNIFDFVVVYLHASHFPTLKMNLFSSRQEGGELANDVISPPHPGHQLPVPALSVGGA